MQTWSDQIDELGAASREPGHRHACQCRLYNRIMNAFILILILTVHGAPTFTLIPGFADERARIAAGDKIIQDLMTPHSFRCVATSSNK